MKLKTTKIRKECFILTSYLISKGNQCSLKLRYKKLTQILMENDFQTKEINAKESVTFQNEENERDVHKERKCVETCNRNKLS